MATSKGGVRITSDALLSAITIYRDELVPMVEDTVEIVGRKATQVMMQRLIDADTWSGRREVRLGKRKYKGRIGADKNTEGSMFNSIWDDIGDEPTNTVTVRTNRNGNVNAIWGVLDAPRHFIWQEYGTKRSGRPSKYRYRSLRYKTPGTYSPEGPGIPGAFAYTLGWAYFSSRFMWELAKQFDELGEAANAVRARKTARGLVKRKKIAPISYGDGRKKY